MNKTLRFKSKENAFHENIHYIQATGKLYTPAKRFKPENAEKNLTITNQRWRRFQLSVLVEKPMSVDDFPTSESHETSGNNRSYVIIGKTINKSDFSDFFSDKIRKKRALTNQRAQN